MGNQNKWNVELLYSIIFFVSAEVVLYLDPLYQILDYLFSSPNALGIRDKFMLLGVDSPFTMTWRLTLLIHFFLLLCSVYIGIQSMRKTPKDDKRKIFNIIPNPLNLPKGLAFLQVLVSSFFIIMFVIIFTNTFSTEQVRVHQKCSNEYADTDAGSAEYLADFDKWTNGFYDTHPGATLSDWSKARYQFWVDNDCEAQLRGYKDAQEGKGDQATIENVRASIQEAVKNSTQ